MAGHVVGVGVIGYAGAGQVGGDDWVGVGVGGGVFAGDCVGGGVVVDKGAAVGEVGTLQGWGAGIYGTVSKFA